MLSKLGERIHITTAEQQLLTSFGKQPNQILSRDDLGLNWTDEWKDAQLTLPLQASSQTRTKPSPPSLFANRA